MIAVENLTYRYANGTIGVREASFRVAQGEIFGFLGPSGAGKSTTQNILIRLLTGYDGRVTVRGRALADWDEDYYQGIGVSFELPAHYGKLTARENLDFFRTLYDGPTETTAWLLDAVGLDRDADTPVLQFSKGMQMRLNVARSLLNRPELLFLDEPTAGLDPGNAARIKALIHAQKDLGRTVFLTTHNMTVADTLCDRVAFIVDGRIALIDTPRNLKLAHGRRLIEVEYGAAGSAPQRSVFPLDDLGNNDAFLRLLQRETIQTVHTKEASLEDIFSAVTGRTLA